MINPYILLDVSYYAHEAHPLLFQSLRHKVKLVQVDLISYQDSSIITSNHIVFLGGCSRAEVFRHLPAEQLPEVKQPLSFFLSSSNRSSSRCDPKLLLHDFLALLDYLLATRELNELPLEVICNRYHVVLAGAAGLVVELILIVHVLIIPIIILVIVPLG